MAEKTQLIRIKFITDAASLDQSAAAAKRAQTATDQLRNSAEKVGSAAAAGNSKWQSSIGSVRTEMERMKSLIEVTSRSDVKLLNERIAKYKQLKAEVDSFNKHLQDTKKVADSNSSAFGSLYDAVKLVFSVAVVRQVVNMALEMATLAGNVEGVSKAFNRLPNSILLLDSLRKGTHGAVTDLQLMQKALQAQNFKIPLQNLGTLFEFAATKAQQTGQEVNHLVDYIVSGIGYRSIKRLDDLGFTANRVKAALNGVTLQAATMQQVMDAVTKLMNEDLQKTGGYAETTATKVEQINVAWEKLKETVAKRTTNSGFLELINQGIQGVRDWFLTNKEALNELAQGQAIKDAKMYLETIAGKDTQDKIEEIQQKMNSLQQAVGRYNDEIKKSQKDVDEAFKTGNVAALDNAVAQRNSLQLTKRTVEETIVVLKQYFATLKTPPDVIDSLGLIEAKLEQIKDAGDRLKDAKTTVEIHSINNELSRLNAELADLKAFGTTKQFLEVNGKIKLVPVVDPKGFQKTIEQEPIFKKGVTIPVNLSFSQGNRSSANSGAGGVQGSLNEQIDKQIQDALKNIPPPKIPVEITPMTPSEKIGQEFADNWRNILSQGLTDTGNFFDSIVQAEADEYDQRLNQSKAYYDKLLTLAGDNENQKDRIRLKAQKEEDKLRREAFEADKRAKRSQALINGAVGITNAFASLPYPAAVVAAALIAASTIAQVAAINREKPRFAKGKINIQGPGTKTSDSIDAKISRGESVITASATERSAKLLEGINSGKIDDRVLRTLHVTKEGIKVVGMDDTRIVKAIREQKHPDYVRMGSDIYEVKESADGLSKRIRRKTMSR